MLRLFRKSVVVFYWIVLVALIALCGGWVTSLLFVPASPQNWAMAGGSAVFAVLIGWRLWLNNRSLGRTSRLPGLKRMLTIFIPLGALALFGGALGCLGVGWITVAIWMFTASSRNVAVAGAHVTNPVLMFLLGVVLIGLAFLSIRPFINRLRYRPPAQDVF